MKKPILALLTAGLCSSLSAQQHFDLSQLGCATVTSPEEVQRVYEFSQLPPPAYKTTSTVDSIPLSIHLVGKSDGTGYYSLDNLFTVICQLNTRYAPVDMYFYIKWPIHYIDNTNYYEHNNSSGAQMMWQNNVPNTVNVYFVEDPAGACGYYNSGPDAVAIAKKCSAPASTTLVHELGHYMGLAHTFYGWEGRTKANPPSNPERVSRSGPGTNCGTRGDGFCDTEADFLSDRWPCPYSDNYQDATGAAYRPDGTVYMSYATDACMTRFTSQQIAFMQSQLHSRRANLLSGSTAPYAVMTEPTIVYPTDLLYANYQKIIWKRVPGAEYYHVKVYRGSLQIDAFMLQQALTTDTMLQLNFTVQTDMNFNVKVEPVMSSNVCRSSSNRQDFVSTGAHTTMSVGNTPAADGALTVVPNPVAGGAFRVQMASLPSGPYQLTLINMNGQKVSHYAYDHVKGSDNQLQFSVQNLPAGMYFLHVTGTGGDQRVEKILIQR